jgi:quinol monooxygenase YgiN
LPVIRSDCHDLAMADGLGGAEVDLTIVTMVFDTADDATLLSVLSKYVVLTRMQPGCRNVDLAGSVANAGRYVIVQKWESPAAQQAHFDSEIMIEMAKSCTGVLKHAPAIDLLEAISAHDLN